MSLGTIIIWTVCIFVSVLVVNAISVYWYAPNQRKNPKKYKAFSSSDFEVDLKEFQEVQRLKELLPSVTNRFCKEQAIIVYFTIQRKYHIQEKDISGSILQLCNIAILQELNYDLFDLSSLYNSNANRVNNPQLCDDIKAEANILISRIDWENGDLYKNTDAWEVFYSHLSEAFRKEDVQSLYDKICWLAEQNNGIMAKRKIYFDSYQHLVDIDREYSLRLYLYYLHASTEIKYRKLSVKNSKVLFRKPGEKERFEAICADILEHKDLEKALELFDRIHISQRKKIALNIQAIKSAAEKQSKVAGVLGEWLNDDEDKVIVNEAPSETIVESPVSKPLKNPKDALFQLFISNSYRINKEEVDIFARSHGLFTSQFVERINDEHFEQLDDVLIEEDEDYYILNEAYCRQIKDNEN